MTDKAEASLASPRVWIAAGATLVGSWILVPAGFHGWVRIANELDASLALSDVAGSVLKTLLLALGYAVAVEGCKALSVLWLLRRRWEGWGPLGAAFGLLQTADALVGGVTDLWRLGPELAPLSPLLPLVAAKAFVTHWALGRLAAGIARPPGGPWLALGLSTLVLTLLSLLPSQPLADLVTLPDWWSGVAGWIELAMAVLFALAVRRWIPWPRPHGEGPARRIAVVAMFGVCLLTAVIVMAAIVFGEPGYDPVSALVVLAGVASVGWMFHRQVLRPWMRRDIQPSR